MANPEAGVGPGPEAGQERASGQDGNPGPVQNGWLLGGVIVLVMCAVGTFFVVHRGEAVFKADGSFATLAGFAVLALALERFCEAVLAPWWGTASAKNVKAAANNAQKTGAAALPPHTKNLLDVRRRLGITDASVVRAAAAKASERASAAGVGAKEAKDTNDAADSAWVKATQARPTIMLPAAGLATVVCACLHLFLLHSVAGTKHGIPTTKLAFAVDALITGLALAGGAKPFHDLVEGIAASSASKKGHAPTHSAGT